MISEFGIALLFIIGALAFIIIGLFVNFLIRPHRPNPEKQTIYECGEDPIGNAWGSFNIRFYVIALIFVLFDVELVFLFPWSTVFGKYSLIESSNGLWGWFSLVEMLVFVGILAMGLIYAWKQGYLGWVKPQQPTEAKKSHVPYELYDAVNRKYSQKPAPPQQ